MSHSPKYDVKIVAFIDILGFENLISSLSDNPPLHKRLYYALSRIKSVRESSLASNTAQSNLDVSTFSDSIVISSSPKDIFDIIWACGWLQAQLLGDGILTRGGISQGLTLHENDILYGEGMLKAYKIESNAAIYPRIVFDPEIVESLNSNIKDKFLAEDIDGLWFIDPFKFEAWVGNADELVADGYDPRELYFEGLEGHIQKGISNCNKVDHLAKWTWLKNRAMIASKHYVKCRG